MTKRTLKSHLQYGYPVYIIAIVVIVILWITLFGYLANPAANESLAITYVGHSVNTENMQSEIKDALPKISDQNIKQLNVELLEREDSELFYSTLATRILGESDIIIWEEKEDGEMKGMGEYYFTEIPQSVIDAYFLGATTYSENGKIYGIQVYDGQTATRFSQSYSADKKCWLFFTGNSCNIGAINGKGKETDVAAFEIAKYLMGVI